MADIRSKLSQKYGIDIKKENLLKIYKLEKPDISSEELEKKFSIRRETWKKSINGTNEKFIERDQAYLDKADIYEEILRDKNYRRELFEFYKIRDNNEKTDISFAKEYFSLVATTKKIKKRDVDFFYDYFLDEKKRKKAIDEMLQKDFKVIGIGKSDADIDENEQIDNEEKKKNEDSRLIVNLFSEAMLLKVRKCEKYYYAVQSNLELCQRYPMLNQAMYDYLNLDKIQNVESMKVMLLEQSDKLFSTKQNQDKGNILLDLQYFYNELKNLMKYPDVVDNFSEFKLLIQYPKLTPYMYRFEGMKESTLKGIFDIANREYYFRDWNDFILSYFQIIYDNFNINDTYIRNIIRKAEKNANKNKVLNKIDEKLGRRKNRTVPFGVNIIHWLVYWPIFVFYFIFEVFKNIFTKVRNVAVPLFLIMLVLFNWILPNIFEVDNMLVLLKIFNKAEWSVVVGEVCGGELEGGILGLIETLISIIYYLMIYVLPSFFVAGMIYESTGEINERIDWIGIERTLKKIFMQLKKKTEDQYLQQKDQFIANKIPNIMVNFVCLLIVILFIKFIP